MNELHTKHFVKVVFCEQLCYTNYVDANAYNPKNFFPVYLVLFPIFRKT